MRLPPHFDLAANPLPNPDPALGPPPGLAKGDSLTALGASSCPRRASAMRWNKPSQSPCLVWRKSRMVGYQGLSSRSLSQRQSATTDRASQTGKPRLPARWETAVSGVMIRSSWLATAAVSRKSRLVLPSVDRARQLHDRKPASQRSKLIHAVALLQTDKTDPLHHGERGDLIQRKGSPPIDISTPASLPEDPDPKRPVQSQAGNARIQDRLPDGNRLWVCREVRNLRGHGRQVRPHDPRQAHHRCTIIVVRQAAVIFKDRVNGVATGNKPDEGAVAKGNDSRRDLDDARVADELERVSQALLGVKQDCLPTQAFTIPALAQRNPARLSAALEPPFIFGPAPLVIAVGEQGEGPASTAFGVIGTSAQRLVVTRHGFVVTSELHQGCTDRGDRLVRLGPQPQRLLKTTNGLVEFSQPDKHRAQVQPGFDAVLLDCDRATIVLGRFLAAVLLPAGGCQIVHDREVIGSELERSPKIRVSLRHAPLLPDDRSQFVKRIRVVGTQPQRLAQIILGVGIHAVRAQGRWPDGRRSS